MFESSSRLEFKLPSECIRAGENQLDFLWDVATRVSDVRPSRDRRILAAAVSSITLDGLEESVSPPAIEFTGQQGHFGPAIILPPTSETRIACKAGSDALLNLAGAGLERLEIWTRQEGEDLHRIGTARANQGRVRLHNDEGPIEIAFRVRRGDPLQLERAELSWRGRREAPGPGPQLENARPDIILYVVDTLRADRLGCYGGPAGISPALDLLANEGVLFEKAVAQSSWTKPSMVSMLSGYLTSEHGVRSREQIIPDRVRLLSEYLHDDGYQTGAFTTNAYLIPASGFNRGFDHFEFSQIPADELSRKGIRWLEERKQGKPLFLWLHSVDPHAPYQPEAPFRERWAPNIPTEIGTVAQIRSLGGRPPEETEPFISPYRALYDAEVAQNDAAIGELVEHLRKTGLYDSSCIVVLSDHGEEFWEHGVNGHGWDLFEEVLHVPFLIKLPGSSRAGTRVSIPVQQIDLLPTLLDLVGIKIPENLRGQDLLSGVPGGDRPIFSEMSYEGREGFAVRSGSFKLIEPLSRNFLPKHRLFDLKADPDEENDRSRDFPVLAAWLAQEGRIRLILESAEAGLRDDIDLNEAEREGLEALGYIKAEPKGP